MTPEQAKQLLPIITAYAAGKKIEVNVGMLQENWQYSPHCNFNGDPSKYRIKPKPILAKAYLRKNGSFDIDIETNWIWCQHHPNFWKWVSEPFEITETSC